jgi:hypothetical protein
MKPAPVLAAALSLAGAGRQAGPPLPVPRTEVAVMDANESVVP